MENVLIDLFSNVHSIKPAWSLTGEIMDICSSTNVSKWSEYVQRKFQVIINSAAALCHVFVSGAFLHLLRIEYC